MVTKYLSMQGILDSTAEKKTKPLFLSTLCSCLGKTLVDSQEHKFDILSGDESSNLSIDSANPTPISGVSREH